MNKKEELLNKFSDEVGGTRNVTIEGFLDFLVEEIERIEAVEQPRAADLATCLECGADLASGHYLICSQSEQ